MYSPKLTILPTVAAEAERISAEDKREEHLKWVWYHFQKLSSLTKSSESQIGPKYYWDIIRKGTLTIVGSSRRPKRRVSQCSQRSIRELSVCNLTPMFSYSPRLERSNTLG